MEKAVGGGVVKGVDFLCGKGKSFSGEMAPHPASGHAWVAGRVHRHEPFRIGHEGLMTLENDDTVARLCRLARGCDAIVVDRLRVASQQARQLARVTSNDTGERSWVQLRRA